MILFYRRNNNPSSWLSYSGMQNQYSHDNVQSRKLKRIIPHPLYNQMTSDYDIALLELSEPLQFANTIQPICLPDSSHVFPAGMSCWVTGWGALREGGIISVMVILWTTVVILNLIKKKIIYVFIFWWPTLFFTFHSLSIPFPNLSNHDILLLHFFLYPFL